MEKKSTPVPLLRISCATHHQSRISKASFFAAYIQNEVMEIKSPPVTLIWAAS